MPVPHQRYPYIQQLAELVGENTLNGTWIQAIASDAPELLNGTWLETLCIDEFGLSEPVNGNWYQSLAEAVGATEPYNGSWLAAAINQI